MARFSVPVPGGFSLETTAIANYWIELIVQSVSPDSTPYEMTVEAVPSGVIYGKVVETDGAEVSDMMVSVLEVAKSPLKKNEGTLDVQPKNSSSSNDGPTRFSAQPLPLGGRYIILAHRRHTYAASESIELTEAQPIREITLKLAPGQEVKGRVLDESNQPVPNAEVSFSFVSIHSSSFGSQGKFTDREGEFRLERVNPEVPGFYQVLIQHVPDYQPLLQKVDFNKLPLVLRLKKGLVLEGVVMDQTTGGVIPNARVNARPRRIEKFGTDIPLSLEATTDVDGRFKFTDMADWEYNLFVQESEATETLVHGGQTNRVVLRVKPSSWSTLKPVKKDLSR
jgi:hypothetical protein